MSQQNPAILVVQQATGNYAMVLCSVHAKLVPDAMQGGCNVAKQPAPWTSQQHTSGLPGILPAA